MAVGDIYNIPSIRKNKNITIGVWGTTLDWNLESELFFNRSEWELTDVEVKVKAQQSYTPLLPFSTVRLDMTYAIRNYNNNGTFTDSGLGTNFLEWGPISAHVEQNAVFRRTIQGVAQTRTALFITANYKLPLAAVSPQNCNVTIDMAFSFQSKVANPSSNPSVRPPKEGGGATNWDLGFVLVVGVLGILGLVALGWAAEKTGVNVGVLGNIYTEGKKAVAAVIPRR